MSYSDIPQQLKAWPQCIRYRLIAKDPLDPDHPWKKKKVPYQAATDTKASVSNPRTWCSWEELEPYLGVPDEGPGFVFTKSDPYCGIDLDDCRDPETGNIDAWALKIIRQVPTYWEVSVSGHGVKGLC